MNREVICFDAVAPARERGLKLASVLNLTMILGRSREGAWIEMSRLQSIIAAFAGRSREGAWIEIFHGVYSLNKYQGRSREGAWIEMFIYII